jgi:hypothetical protein
MLKPGGPRRTIKMVVVVVAFRRLPARQRLINPGFWLNLTRQPDCLC